MRVPWLTAGNRAARMRARLARPGTAALLAALAIELVDEMVDGTKGGVLPLIRHDLALSYLQVGLLTAVPLIAGSLLELPVGVLSGGGARRHRVILGGGVVFIAAVAAAALAGSFAVLVIALTVFFPASGAFVGLTQAALMDAQPGRRAPLMARWTLAGSAGALAGPLLAAAVLGAGATWRVAFGVVAAASAAAWAGAAVSGRQQRRLPEPADGAGAPRADGADGADSPAGEEEAGEEGSWPGWRQAAVLVRRSGALRPLILIEAADICCWTC